MKSKREMPLGQALDEIASTVERVKKDGAARANGYEVKLDEPVMLEIETEAEKGKAEMEFEIKWEAKGKKGRRVAGAFSSARWRERRSARLPWRRCGGGGSPRRKKRSSSAVCGSASRRARK